MKIVIEMPPEIWTLVREGHIPVRAYDSIVKGMPLRCVLDEMRREIKEYTFKAHGTKFIYIDRLNHILNKAESEEQ